MSIESWLGPVNPLPTISPFTYRDGETQLETLERFRQYINNDLVEFVNTTFADISSGLTDEVNALITNVNTIISTILEEASLDPAMYIVLNNTDSTSRVLLNSLYDLKGAFSDANIEAIINDPASATTVKLNSLYESIGTFTDHAVKVFVSTVDSETRVELDSLYASIDTPVSDAAVEAIIADGSSLTRVELDSLYASTGAFNDAALNTILSNDGTASRGTLDAAYAPISTVSFTDGALETIIANPASASRVELNSLFVNEADLDNEVETLVATGGSATRVELDAIYLHSSGLDAAVEALGANPASATRVELDTVYAPHSTVSFTDSALETIIANPASASRIELDTLYKKPGTVQGYEFATPAAIQALAGMNIGDIGYLAGDGTNFNWCELVYDGHWRVTDVNFIDDNPTHWAAFITYLVLGTNTHIKLEGSNGVAASTGAQVVYNVLLSVYTLVKLQNLRLSLSTAVGAIPTGFVGTSAVVNSDGTMTLTAITTVLILGALPTIAINGSDECKIKIIGSHAAASNDQFTIEAADQSTYETWYTHGTKVIQTGVVSAITDLGDAAMTITDSGNGGKFEEGEIYIAHGNMAANTYAKLDISTWDALIVAHASDMHIISTGKTATAYSMVRLDFGSAFTGTIKATLV